MRAIVLITAAALLVSSCGCRETEAEKAAKAAQLEWKRAEIQTLYRYYEMAKPIADQHGMVLPEPDSTFLLLFDGQEFNDMVDKTMSVYKRIIP